MPYVSHRWLGGLLTNFSTIENRIRRMHELRKLKEEGQLGLLPTKERMSMERELEKLEINLGGVSNMTRLPDAVFVADPKREAIATKEVNKLGLPLIGLVDTNCDPDEVDYLIPGNDDAIRSCGLIVKTLTRAVEEGRQKVQVAEFLAAEAARAAAEAKVRSAPDTVEGSIGTAPDEAPASRVLRASRLAAGEGRTAGQGRTGPGGRSAGPGRPGAGARSAGQARPGPREGAPPRTAPRRSAARPAAPAKTGGAPGGADVDAKEMAAEAAVSQAEAGEPQAVTASLVSGPEAASEAVAEPGILSEAAPTPEVAPSPEAVAAPEAVVDAASDAAADAPDGDEPEA
jgi:small subunit ribosomal protein S2